MDGETCVYIDVGRVELNKTKGASEPTRLERSLLEKRSSRNEPSAACSATGYFSRLAQEKGCCAVCSGSGSVHLRSFMRSAAVQSVDAILEGAICRPKGVVRLACLLTAH